MKNTAEKIITIGLEACLLALGFVFLFFATKSYTEKVVIWLPDNYELENTLSNEVVSIMPNPDTGHQPNKVFYLMTDMDSFKKLFGKSEMVSVKIEEASPPYDQKYYRIIYQKKFDCADKSFIVAAQEHYKYNRTTLSEMRLRDGTLFLKYKRDENLLCIFSIFCFIAIAYVVYLNVFSIDKRSKQNKD